jgi:LmbE family N-acetylglucosaminyl deacetylase
MKAIVAVAHPDDCIIYASAYMNAHPEYSWHIVYLTFKDTDARAKEIRNYWNKKNITTKFLGFYDNVRDFYHNKLHFWSENDVKTALVKEVCDAELLLTHGVEGEYGHIHHKTVHNAIVNLPIKKIFFSNNGKIIYPITVDLSEIPLHRDAVAYFTETKIAKYEVQDSDY